MADLQMLLSTSTQEKNRGKGVKVYLLRLKTKDTRKK